MKPLVTTERWLTIGHGIAMAFGLAGLLIVLPHPDLIARLSPAGLQLFQWSMNQGGVAYILLGAAAVAVYLYRQVGWYCCITFAVPAITLSLASELLGTSTGFPFGDYRYLAGLGYKVAGLVPFTIPLSWFYMGACCYLLARVGWARLEGVPGWTRSLGAIALGSWLLLAWDLVLDPAMSQSPFPFWEFQVVGEFFGMPYRNLSGWLATGALFMSVASLFWRDRQWVLSRGQLTLPVCVYIVNFAFGALISLVLLGKPFWVPITLGLLFGVGPVLALWWRSPGGMSGWPLHQEEDFGLNPEELKASPVKVAAE